MQPINYGAMLTQIDLTPLQRGLQLRDQRRESQQIVEARSAATDLAREKFAATQAQDAAWQGDVTALLANPTVEGYQTMFVKYPDKLEGLKAGYEAQADGVKTRNRDAAMETLGLISAGAIPQAVTRLKSRREMLAKAGETTEVTDTLIADLESGDEARINRAKGTAAMVLYPALGDKAPEILTTLGLGAKAANEERKLDIAESRAESAERRADASIRQGEARLELSERASGRADAAAARADRKASGKGGGGDAYEYRIGPDGKLQRRKR